MPHPLCDSWQRTRTRPLLDLRSHRRLHRNQRQLSNLMLTRRAVIAAACAVLARADPPRAVCALLRAAAEALDDKDPAAFLDLFDRSMPGYGQLRDDIEALLAAEDVSSTIEVV